MTSTETSPPSYWFTRSDDDARGSRVMEALRQYRAAEMTMRRQTQASMGMGENELLVLRFLTRAEGEDRDVTPIELARHLGVSTASVTALLDRLERSGYLRRRPHPADRRKIIVAATSAAHEEMRETLSAMHGRMMSATRGMSEAEAAAVTAFLERMRCAVADVCAATDAACCMIARRPDAATGVIVPVASPRPDAA